MTAIQKFWERALGNNSELATLAKEAIAELEILNSNLQAGIDTDYAQLYQEQLEINESFKKGGKMQTGTLKSLLDIAILTGDVLNTSLDINENQIKLQLENNALKLALNKLVPYFTSGNDVPVSLATIKASTFWEILTEAGIESKKES